ncbi:UNVERIFIED_CONTAM: hypothetical protein H355_009650, partial [Colinus virginianus]
MAHLEQAECSVEHRAAGAALGPLHPEFTHPGTAALRLHGGPGSARKEELRAMLMQSSSLSRAMRAAAVQTAASGPGLLAGPQESSPKVPSLALRREWLLALAGGDTKTILGLLEQDPSLLSTADPVTGFTALHWLAKHGQQKSFAEVISSAQLVLNSVGCKKKYQQLFFYYIHVDARNYKLKNLAFNK